MSKLLERAVEALLVVTGLCACGVLCVAMLLYALAPILIPLLVIWLCKEIGT
jgi:hypothetical protein